MLVWYRELYAATAADAAATFLTRLWTPDGMLHDSGTSRRISKREDWEVHYLQVYVLKTTTGYMKPGLVGQLIVARDEPGSWLPLGVEGYGCHTMNRGLVYKGPPFRATHGVGWAFYKGALADTDKVALRVLYETVERGPL